MINQTVIDEVRNRLVKAYDPVAIYLFGSYAWGSPDDESDLDLLIVIEKSDLKSYHRHSPGQRALFGLGISKDLIIYTQAEFNHYRADITTLCHDIEKNGKLLYVKA